MNDKNLRSFEFKTNGHGRYWWFHQNQNSYVPPVFSFLDDKEWNILNEWYVETDKMNLIGECNIPAISFIQGIIMGNATQKVVQLGSYVGFSALLIGFMMRKMGFKNSFVTIDHDSHSASIAQYWINRASLNDYVKQMKQNSTDIGVAEKVAHYFGNKKPQLIFVNSSYAYEHTMQELALWYPSLASNGIMLMHNANDFANQYDPTKKGGVARALQEWSHRTGVNYFVLNSSIERDKNYQPDDVVYRDLGGLAIIQK